MEELGSTNTLLTEEGLRKIIECPICLSIPFAPITMCTQGHIVCSGCQERTHMCPLCRSGYRSTRNFLAEGLVEKCTLRCKYVEDGCQMICKGSDMPDHLKECDFRPIKCDDCKGNWINSQMYALHLFDHHKINGDNSSEGFVAYNMNLRIPQGYFERYCWPQYYFKAYETTFLLRLYATNWFICSWVGLLGSKEDCKKYRVKMELHLPSEEAMTHTWSGQVCHFRDDPSLDVYSKGRGLITLLQIMETNAAVSTDVAEWMYHVKITELQTEGNSTDPNATSTPMECGTSGNPGTSGTNATIETVQQTVNAPAPVVEQTGANTNRFCSVMQVSDIVSSSISKIDHPTANAPLWPSLGSTNSVESTCDSAMLYTTRF